MKDKVQKVILIISFIPYILQILCVGLVIYYTEFYEAYQNGEIPISAFPHVS